MAYHLVPVTQFKFADQRYDAATSIRRIRPSTHEFLVGVNRDIKIVYFDYNTFREIHTINSLHSGSQNSRRYGR